VLKTRQLICDTPMMPTKGTALKISRRVPKPAKTLLESTLDLLKNKPLL
jgi:hypothetical protein